MAAITDSYTEQKGQQEEVIARKHEFNIAMVIVRIEV